MISEIVPIPEDRKKKNQRGFQIKMKQCFSFGNQNILKVGF